MQKQSAGILLYRLTNKILEVMLVHPGGPFWKNKDAGAWSIPKGEFTEEENALAAAKRELKEELGMMLTGNFIELTPVKQKNGKTVHAWALETDVDVNAIKSNTFETEWPPRSGKKQQFPEIDRGEWLNIADATVKINEAQGALIKELIIRLREEKLL